MTNRVLLGLLLAVALILMHPASAQSSEQPAVTYNIIQRYDRLAYEVQLTFLGLRSGKTAIGLPASFATAMRPERGIRNLRVLTPGVKLVATEDITRVNVEHQPNEALTIAYDFEQIDAAPPRSSGRTQFLPFMQSSYLHWMGPTTWVFPLIPSRGDAVIRFANLPENWALASNFGTQRELRFKWSPNTLLRSLIVAGDFRVITRSMANNKRVTLAVRGDWKLDDSQLADSLLKIVVRQREFWGDPVEEDFLVTLIPIEKDGPSAMTGSALQESFTTFATPDKTRQDIERLWMHESLHQWIPKAFGGVEPPQGHLLWFSEGFTDYFTHVWMLRWALADLESFVNSINEILLKSSTSRYSTLNNAEVAASFGRATDIQQLPYWRGMLLAASWDNDIRKSSRGAATLEDAIKWLRDEQRALGKPLNRSRIEAMATRFGVVDPGKDIESFVESPVRAEVRLETSMPCLVQREKKVVEPLYAFDVVRSRLGRKLIGVRESSPAYELGLRNESEVVDISDISQTGVNSLRVSFRDGSGKVNAVEVRADSNSERTIPAYEISSHGLACNTFVGVSAR